MGCMVALEASGRGSTPRVLTGEEETSVRIRPHEKRGQAVPRRRLAVLSRLFILDGQGPHGQGSGAVTAEVAGSSPAWPATQGGEDGFKGAVCRVCTWVCGGSSMAEQLPVEEQDAGSSPVHRA